MDDSQIDDAVLGVANASWQKVAMILLEAADKLRLQLTDETCGLVARRIEALIYDGRLEARGNTKSWRSSEIRRIPEHSST